MKFVDPKTHEPVDQAMAGTYEAWRTGSLSSPFARHPSGIYLLLSPERADDCDAYRAGLRDLDGEEISAFQQMRLWTTLSLLEGCVQSSPRTQRLLDVGCGTGFILEGVVKKYPLWEAAGMDVSLPALEKAAQRLPSVTLVLADGHTPPFPKEFFTVILLNNVLEHVEDPIAMLRNLAYVLAPEGWMVISTPNRYRFDNLKRVLLGRPVVLNAPDHVTEYSVGQVLEFLALCGFKVHRIEAPVGRPKHRTVLNLASGLLIKPVLRRALRVIGSHHVIDSTVFFLARRSSPGCKSLTGL